MAYQFKPFEKTVGSFVIASIATLVLLGLFLARKQGLFFGPKQSEYYAWFNKGDSLGDKMNVIYNGFVIGNTLGKELMPDDRVRIKFTIKPDYTNRVKTDSVAWLNEGLLPGSTVIRITKGRTSSSPVANGATLWSSDDPEGRAIAKEINGRIYPPAWMDRLVTVIMDLVDMLGRDDGPVMSLLATVNKLMKMEPNSPLGGIVSQVHGLMGTVGEIMAKVKDPDTSIGALLGDNKVFYNRLNAIMRSTDDTMKSTSILVRNLSQMGLLGGGSGKEEKPMTAEKNDRFDAYSNR